MLGNMSAERRVFGIIQVGILVVLAFGLTLRIAQYVAGRSLWMDEAMLALNIADRSFVELAQPLDYDQGAPVGFLLIQKLILQALGNKDYVLRLFPLLAGFLSLYLIYRVADRYTSGVAVMAASVFFAVSSPLVYYASEAKQYSSDVAICLLLLLVAAGCLSTEGSPKHFAALAITGTLALWFSHPALFVMAGIGPALALHRLVRRDWRRLSWIGVVFLAWLISLAAIYLLSLRFLIANHTLIEYWNSSFMPMPPWQELAWFPDAFLTMLKDPVGLSAVSVALLALLVGCFSLLWRNWVTGLALILPFLITLLASGLRAYPFGGRLLLFLAPLVFLLIAEGLERMRLIFARANSWVSLGAWLIPALLLAYAPAVAALENLARPNMGEHIKPVMSYVAHQKLEGDEIYVYYGAEFSFRYYARHYGFSEDDYVVGTISREDPDIYIQELNGLAGHGRTWFVFTHVYNWGRIDEEVLFLEHLDELGTRLDEFRAPGASAFLYDLEAHKYHVN